LSFYFKNYSFPSEAGYRLDPTDKPNYILFEIHYDNPDLNNDIIDDSGVSFYLTETLRKHDLGCLVLGSLGIPFSIQIPPKSNKLEFKSTCYPQCSEKFISNDGIYAVSSLLHTHLTGRSVKITLVRNGVEIQELFANPTYDFNYQFLMDIEPVKILKVTNIFYTFHYSFKYYLQGDALITTCSYDSNNRENFTYVSLIKIIYFYLFY